MSVAATIGKIVPPWKRIRWPLPFCASLAAFLVDELLATGMAIGGRHPQATLRRRQRTATEARSWAYVPDGRRRGMFDDPAAPGGPGSGRRVVDQAPATGVEVVGQDHDTRPGRVERGSRCRHRSRPGGGERYVFDGTLASPRPAFRGTTWTSPLASAEPRRAGSR